MRVYDAGVYITHFYNPPLHHIYEFLTLKAVFLSDFPFSFIFSTHPPFIVFLQHPTTIVYHSILQNVLYWYDGKSLRPDRVKDPLLWKGGWNLKISCFDELAQRRYILETQLKCALCCCRCDGDRWDGRTLRLKDEDPGSSSGLYLSLSLAVGKVIKWRGREKRWSLEGGGGSKSS